MDLSNRLQAIADRIEKGETMADIGTDHGFLPIYLLENKICPKVIMADISRLSLSKGRNNLEERFGADEKVGPESFQFRTGDGISVLEPSEVDTVVIAGMGGKLIRDIMRADIELTRSFGKFILQPRKSQGPLRKWLLENGFAIIGEDIAKEGKYFPEIITAASPDAEIVMQDGEGLHITKSDISHMKDDDEDSVYYRVPPWITNAQGPVEEFLSRHLSAEKKKLENVMLSKERNRRMEDEICEAIYYIKDLIKECGDGK